MPGGDRTGPMGMGPMTGRGAGYCAGFGVPGFVSGGAGPAFGGGRGRRGRRNQFYATGLTGWQRAMASAPAPVAPPPVAPAPVAPAPAAVPADLEVLKQQAANLAATLDSLRQQIETLQGQQAAQ